MGNAVFSSIPAFVPIFQHLQRLFHPFDHRCVRKVLLIASHDCISTTTFEMVEQRFCQLLLLQQVVWTSNSFDLCDRRFFMSFESLAAATHAIYEMIANTNQVFNNAAPISSLLCIQCDVST